MVGSSGDFAWGGGRAAAGRSDHRDGGEKQAKYKLCNRFLPPNRGEQLTVGIELRFRFATAPQVAGDGIFLARADCDGRSRHS